MSAMAKAGWLCPFVKQVQFQEFPACPHPSQSQLDAREQIRIGMKEEECLHPIKVRIKEGEWKY